MMIMTIKLSWADLVSLIHSPYGWRNRYDLNLSFGGSGDNSFTWRGLNYRIIVLGNGEEKNSLLGLFMDNDKPVDDEAVSTWKTFENLLSQYRVDREQKLPKKLTERLKKLNQLSEIWVRIEKDKHYTMSDFLMEYATDLGIFVTESEFKKHLPKARKWEVIGFNNKKRRYIPMSN